MQYKKIGSMVFVSLTVLLLAWLGWSYIWGGWRISSVQTNSMTPVVAVGTLVIVRQNSAEGLQPGEIGMYQTAAGETVVHRLQAILPNGQYVFRGDSNPANDQPVYKRQVIGGLSYTVPYIGTLATFMKSWLGLVICIYIPAVLFIAYEVNGLARRLSAANDKSFRHSEKRT